MPLGNKEELDHSRLFATRSSSVLLSHSSTSQNSSWAELSESVKDGRVRRWSGAARIPVLPPSPLPGHCSRRTSGWPSWRLSARRTWRRKRSLPRLSEPQPFDAGRIRRVERRGWGGENKGSVSEPRRRDAAQTESWFGIGNGALHVWSSSMCRADMCRCGSRSRLLVGPVSG